MAVMESIHFLAHRYWIRLMTKVRQRLATRPPEVFSKDSLPSFPNWGLKRAWMEKPSRI